MSDSAAERNDWSGFKELLKVIVLSMTVVGICYYCYFLIAPWVWSQNIPFRPEDLTPLILEATAEHDGVEIYALYILVFVSSLVALFCFYVVDRIPIKSAQWAVVAVCTAAAGSYCMTLGFTPPMSNAGTLPLVTIARNSLPLILITSLFLALMLFLQQRLPRLVPVIAAILLVPVCFVATAPISMFDYSFIFAPALRLLHGVAMRDIYFQYDLLPSLLAAAWLKLGLDLNRFQILGQAAYFLAIFSVFIFSGRLFQRKELAIVLLAALVLIRIYASPWDVVYCFQVTPLRLDLWLPLLAVVCWRGPYHWSAGLICGLLILLLKNFGIIYSLAYVQLLITLAVITLLDNGIRTPSFRILAEQGKRCIPSLVLIACAFAVSSFLFTNPEFPNYSGYYQKLGIGFIQISSTSFYWYILALISAVFILLFRLRGSLPQNYLTCGLLLTFCAIGNSIYFFGRSHEHNILNISIVLLFLCFFMLDLISRLLQKNPSHNGLFSILERYGSSCVAVVIVLAAIIYYSDNIAAKKAIQTAQIYKGQTIFPLEVHEKAFGSFLSRVRTVTGHSSKVYFVGGPDFEFYYYGGYAPVGYCNPFPAWIFNRELTRFLQGLLDNGYYLVCNREMHYLLASLHYSQVNKFHSTVVVSRM